MYKVRQKSYQDENFSFSDVTHSFITKLFTTIHKGSLHINVPFYEIWFTYIF